MLPLVVITAVSLLLPGIATATTDSFTTPGAHDWVVPAGVNSATFTVVGARGGNSAPGASITQRLSATAVGHTLAQWLGRGGYNASSMRRLSEASTATSSESAHAPGVR